MINKAAEEAAKAADAAAKATEEAAKAAEAQANRERNRGAAYTAPLSTRLLSAMGIRAYNTCQLNQLNQTFVKQCSDQCRRVVRAGTLGGMAHMGLITLMIYGLHIDA